MYDYLKLLAGRRVVSFADPDRESYYIIWNCYVLFNTQAGLVVFEKDPLEDPLNLLSRKTVIKDGMIYSESRSK